MIDHNERAAEARALRQAAADVRSMHDPVASDCDEWAAWLEARAERVISGVTHVTDRSEPSVQPPTREQIAKAKALVDLSKITGAPVPEGVANTAVLALFPQPTPSEVEVEVEVEGSFFPVAELPDILARHMRALDEAHRREKQHWINHHEEPTLSAEPTYEPCGIHGMEFDDDCGWCWVETTAEPVNIADMAPGTTFGSTVDQHNTKVLRFMRTSEGTVDEDGTYWPVADIDPSTIRDITPPPATPEEGR